MLPAAHTRHTTQTRARTRASAVIFVWRRGCPDQGHARIRSHKWVLAPRMPGPEHSELCALACIRCMIKSILVCDMHRERTLGIMRRTGATVSAARYITSITGSLGLCESDARARLSHTDVLDERHDNDFIGARGDGRPGALHSRRVRRRRRHTTDTHTHTRARGRTAFMRLVRLSVYQSMCL